MYVNICIEYIFTKMIWFVPIGKTKGYRVHCSDAISILNCAWIRLCVFKHGVLIVLLKANLSKISSEQNLNNL